MKFVWLVSALVVSAEAVPHLGRSLPHSSVVDRLMSKAVRVDPQTLEQRPPKQSRQLNNDNDNNIVTSAHSIQFDQCVSLKLQAPDDSTMFTDLIEYTKQGTVVAEKSYVLFQVCETQYCSYKNTEEDTYMIDLATYMGALVEYLPTQRASYCEACQEAQDYCQYVCVCLPLVYT
jgi:hypothetical protein